ncbi:MAG TPA: PrsW family glutamic-type intramembrane protease [bacterium]|nr:PrsW family glutamic-type intramembrane protease [bacterium]
MTDVLAIAVSVLPVFLFLGALVLIDSYKLVTLRAVLLSVAAGAVAGLASYGVNVALRPALGLDVSRYSWYVAPVVEETLKATFVAYLLRRNKVGFVVDAAIHGFGIGTGFAVLENIYYLYAIPGATLWTWIVRGVGTAITHGGATAIVAMVSRTLQNRFDAFRPWLLLPGLGVAVVLHSLYNHFLLNPLLATALIVLVIPILSVAVFTRSERETETWVGTGFDTHLELLRVVRSGQVSESPVGRYLTTLRTRFPPEVIVDMMCLLRLRAELAIRAKGVLMMREAGFETPPDPALKDTLEELRYLEKSIGKTGLRALHPFLDTGMRDLWQFQMLGEL